jgi:hypothetical protein
MFLIDVIAGQKLYTISYLLLLPYVYLFIYLFICLYLKGEVKMLPAYLLSTWQASHDDHMFSDILERKQLKTRRYLPNQC